MELNKLEKITTRGKKRGGQGHGSGRVKTAGRGTKGQNARNKVPLFFEGGALPLIKRLPFRRGKDRNKSFKRRPIAINVAVLNVLPPKTVVDIDSITKHNIVEAKDAAYFGVKILGRGEVTVPLLIALPITKPAFSKIEKAGGSMHTVEKAKSRKATS